MKIWITKYALTKGVYEVEAEIFKDYPRMARVSGTDYHHHPDWHTSREKAMAQAEKMRVNKLATLREQIAKLENVTFVEVGHDPLH